jgi:hypothetical protein
VITARRASQFRLARYAVGCVLLCLGATAGLVAWAWNIYPDVPEPQFVGTNAVERDSARYLLQVGVVGIGTALVSLLLTWYAYIRSTIKEDADRRLDLLQRTRAAHVRIIRAKQLMTADPSSETYRTQMQKLMHVSPDLEDICADAQAAKHLFRKDDDQIRLGLEQIVQFLHRGYDEYIRHPPNTAVWRTPPREWLTAVTGSADGMPSCYEVAVTMSKGRMRHHVYGSPGPETTICAFGEVCRTQDGAELSVSASADGGSPPTVRLQARVSHSDLVPTLFSACSGGGPAKCVSAATSEGATTTVTYEVVDPAAEFTIGVRISAHGASERVPAALSPVYFRGSPADRASSRDGFSRGTRTRRGTARTR